MRLEFKTITLAAAGLELKTGDDGPCVLTGYASTFGGEPDRQGDVIEAGAYAETIKGLSGDTLPMLWNHNPDVVIGKWVGMREDEKGLVAEGELTPGHSVARDVEASLRHGAVKGLSIGYRPVKARSARGGIRVLEKIELREVSVVTTPANPRARVTGVKSDDIDSLRLFEAFLREHGWSRREAELIAAKGFAAFLAREGEGGGKGDRDPRDEGGEGAVSRLLATLRSTRLPQPDQNLVPKG